ncbi:MAG: cadherin-like beta sandwich domain-containing protein [Peptococcia bacterium]
MNEVREELTAHYQLGADIDLSVYENWVPIGDWENSFTGSFDGNGYVISNMTIDMPEEYYLGLFGVAWGGSSLNNVKLENASVVGAGCVGGLAGDCAANTVNNCSVRGRVTALSDSYAGGLIGGSSSEVNNCYMIGEVAGRSATGGLLGGNNNEIRNCYAIVSVSAPASNYVGGLVGENNDSIIDCYAVSAVIGNRQVGGLVGRNSDVIRNCFSVGSVEGVNYCGGLAGTSSYMAENCYSHSSVSGSTNTGGLIGADSATITNCYAAGLVTGEGENFGGLCGDADSIITSSYYDSDTTGQTDEGKGVGKTTDEMQQQGTFGGWDFAEVWGLVAGKNDGYPYLLAFADNEADLADLSVSAGTLSPVFADTERDYTVNVAYGTAVLQVVPECEAETASLAVTVNGETVSATEDAYAAPLNVGENLIRIVVTAEDEMTGTVYRLRVNRGEADTNADLAGLSLNEGNVPLEFTGDITGYNLTVSNKVRSLSVKPVTVEETAVVTVNGVAVSSGENSEPIALRTGSNVVTIQVVAEDGTEKTYTLNIKRKHKSQTSTTSITEETEEQQTPEEEGQADNQASNDDSGLADNHKKPGSTGYDNIQWGEFIKWLLSNLSKLALLRLI